MTEESGFVEEIPSQSEDFARWYRAVVLKAELADYTPVAGFMAIRPYGYALWENMQAGLDQRFKATGHVNAYFPLLIPESLMVREAEHVAGFNPELPWVTEAGGKALPERLAIRPTSEAIILTMYAKWVKSWRDLPILINQWANVVRWEMRTRLFLRTSEFLWQEGHTAHRTEQEANEEVLQMLSVYQDFLQTELAIPVIRGRKSEAEKFAGAVATYSIEAMMGDGQALQAGTSHFFGQRFSQAFDITFLDIDGERRHAWTTSWGASTRLIGALTMVHGDDRGLIMPPRIAPYQVVIVPIFRSDQDRATVVAAVDAIKRQLAGQVRIHVDWSDHTPGWKFNEWELRGAPLRLEVGPRDVANEQVVAVRRDTRTKEIVKTEVLSARLAELLEAIQGGLLERALAFRASRTFVVASLAELAEQIEQTEGFFDAAWCGAATCEAEVKTRTKATLRCMPLEPTGDPAPCLVCQKEASPRAIFARAY